MATSFWEPFLKWLVGRFLNDFVETDQIKAQGWLAERVHVENVVVKPEVRHPPARCM